MIDDFFCISVEPILMRTTWNMRNVKRMSRWRKMMRATKDSHLRPRRDELKCKVSWEISID